MALRFTAIVETRPSGGIVYHVAANKLVVCTDVYMLAPTYATRAGAHAPEFVAATKRPPSINCPPCREGIERLTGRSFVNRQESRS